MSSVNKAILIGNVGADPEVRYLDRGTAIATFNLVTSERSYVMQNGTVVPEHVDWHSIVLWRSMAEWAEKNVRKGMKLYVEGKMQTRRWEKDGVIKQKTEIIADSVQILYRPDDNRSRQRQAVEESAEPQQAEAPTPENEQYEPLF
ncbi:MAG: single-stranded DNA-binding protein [Paludibacteraceae bacterium]|nr:single-stranded DNA-binding protein [Paludibacteraceae bacterium]